MQKESQFKHSFTFCLKLVFFMLLVCLSILGCRLDEKQNFMFSDAGEGLDVYLMDHGDYYRWNGDMLLSKNDPYHKIIIEKLKNPQAPGAARSTYDRTMLRPWPRGYVTYYFQPGWTDTQKNVVRSAMNTFQNVCDVKFVETYQFQQSSYILELTVSYDEDDYSGGGSTVGYNTSPYIFIDASRIDNPTLLHELGHTLTMMHEH